MDIVGQTGVPSPLPRPNPIACSGPYSMLPDPVEPQFPHPSRGDDDGPWVTGLA